MRPNWPKLAGAENVYTLHFQLFDVLFASKGYFLRTYLKIEPFKEFQSHFHTGKCIRRFAGIYADCRYFIDRKW